MMDISELHGLQNHIYISNTEDVTQSEISEYFKWKFK